MPGYPIRIIFDNPKRLFTASSRDFPGVRAFGSSCRDARTHMHREILDGIARAIRLGLPVPEPSVRESGEEWVSFSLLVSLKIALHNTMLRRGLRKAWLAREMALHAPQISRLLNVHHASRVEMLEKALHLTGSRVHVQVERLRDDAIL